MTTNVLELTLAPAPHRIRDFSSASVILEGFCTGYLQGRPAPHRTPGLHHIGYRTFSFCYSPTPLPSLSMTAVGFFSVQVPPAGSFHGAPVALLPPDGGASLPKSFFSFFCSTLSGGLFLVPPLSFFTRRTIHRRLSPSSVAYVRCHLYRPSGDSLALLY